MKRSYFFYATSFLVLLCIIFVPFPFYLFRFQLPVTDFLFGNLIGWISSNIFNKPLLNTEVHSDATAMYILVFLLLSLALLLAFFAKRSGSTRIGWEKLLKLIYNVALYYLALQLLKYGLDKLFKNQFYLPEPNILFTPLGKVPRDLLYWSSMGTSQFYNVFLGTIELLAALMMLVKRTRLIGLLLCFFILINILAINIGFDINVKLFTILLLICNCYLLVPYIRNLWQFFMLKKTTGLEIPGDKPLLRNSWWQASLKWFLIGIILLECLLPFIRSGNFNGDLAKRPPMHGAYQVQFYVRDTDTLSPPDYPFIRFFIHRDSYLIFQDQEDGMTDYKLSATQQPGEFILTNYDRKQTRINIDYREVDSVLTIRYWRDSQLNLVKGKAIDWRKLPALKKEFHWTLD